MAEQVPSSNYIIRFKEGTGDEIVQKAKDEVKSVGGVIKHEYTLFKGFSAKLPAFHANSLKSHPDVEGVEADQEVKIN